MTESNEAYHADREYVSASMLKALDKSPRIFEAEYITGTLTRESKAMDIGTAVHTLALEPDEFDRRYGICEVRRDGRTKAYKEWVEANRGKTALTIAEHHTIVCCVYALQSIPLVGRLLAANGSVEQSIRHIDEDTGVPCRVRCDKIVAEVLLDIKTTAELNQRKFSYACEDFGYHIQDAHYRSIVRQSLGITTEMIFAVVETSQPYRARMFTLDSESQQHGDDRRFELLTEYQDRMASGDWSEPGEHDIHPVTLPSIRRRNFAK